MKKFTKTSKVLLAVLTTAACAATAAAFTACDGTPDGAADGITKYSASFDASIVMGPMGEQSFGGVFSDAYVTAKNGEYTLTVIFTAGELSVGGLNGTIFVDDNPVSETETDGVLGFYNVNGDLVTNGVTVTYSSGDNYAVNPAQQNVYYVQSASFPVDGLRASYGLSLYINSNMMGAQFNKDAHSATLTLDLESGEAVSEIKGLGVDTRGTVPSTTPDESDPDEPDSDETDPDGSVAVLPVAGEYIRYDGQLDSIVAMGQDVNFTENLLGGIYATEKDGKYEITLIFKSDVINMPYGNVMTGFLTSAESVDYNGNRVTPVFGYYEGETLVTDGVSLTYSSGDDYVAIKGGNYYYVQSMTFTVDALEDSYTLSVYVMAGNDSSSSSMQFPYTLKNGGVCNAVLAIDLTKAEKVDSIDSLLGVDTLEEVEA